MKEIAHDFVNSTNFLYLGRGFNFPAALEGALKLKEISYIHAEGYPAAEMKHGPIALIDENMPIVIIAQKKGHYDKIVSNVQEIKARKGKVIAVVNYGDEQSSFNGRLCNRNSGNFRMFLANSSIYSVTIISLLHCCLQRCKCRPTKKSCKICNSRINFNQIQNILL